MYTVSKKTAFLFLSELRQISINFNKFWYVMAKWLRLYAIYTFSTWPDPRHYTTLLNVDVLNFYVTQDLLESDCSYLVSKWRGHTVATTFLLRGHCQICALSQDEFFCVSIGPSPSTSRTQCCRFPGARQRCETRHCLSTCVRVHGAHFEREFWQFWADLSWRLKTLQNKHFSLPSSVVR